MNCPGSVSLSEGIVQKPSVWAQEGTEAHEVLESFMMAEIDWCPETEQKLHDILKGKPHEMIEHARNATRFITDLHTLNRGSEIQVETRISLPFIHEAMFGTFDGAVIDHFGTLHVFDYKYGAGVPVSPGTLKNPNLQMSFYGMGLAHAHQWNFKNVRLWIIQPRVAGYEGPLYLEMRTEQLQSMVEVFRSGVRRVENNPDEYVEGSHCHWCPAKSICPLKREMKNDKARSIFSINPIKGEKEPWEP